MALPQVSYQDFTGPIRLYFTPQQYADADAVAQSHLRGLYLKVFGASAVSFMEANLPNVWPPLWQKLSGGFVFQADADDLGTEYKGLQYDALRLAYFDIRRKSDSRHTPSGNVVNLNENSDPAKADAYRSAALAYNEASQDLNGMYDALNQQVKIRVLAMETTESARIEGVGFLENSELIVEKQDVYIGGQVFKVASCIYEPNGQVIIELKSPPDLTGQEGYFTPTDRLNCFVQKMIWY